MCKLWNMLNIYALFLTVSLPVLLNLLHLWEISALACSCFIVFWSWQFPSQIMCSKPFFNWTNGNNHKIVQVRLHTIHPKNWHTYSVVSPVLFSVLFQWLIELSWLTIDSRNHHERWSALSWWIKSWCNFMNKFFPSFKLQIIQNFDICNSYD